MERLTEECWKNLDPWECCGQDKFCTRGCHDKGGCTNGCIVPKMYCGLAKYEDIGLTPEQIREVDKLYTEKCEELAKYKKLEEQGRLLELPCKEGTPVYMVERDCGGDTIACHYRECETCGDLYHYVEQNAFEAYMRDDIGKTVFLTKEEAEAALKNY